MSINTLEDLLAARKAAGPFRRDPEALAEHKRARAALNAEAQANWHDETWHREMARLISERLDYGFEFNNLFSTYFEVENVGEFDVVTVEERRGLKVFWTARGGYIDESQLTTDRWELPRDTVGFHVSEFVDKLRKGYAETLEELITLAEQRLEAEVNRRMLQMLQTAIPSSSDYYVDATTGLTKAMLDTAVMEVADNILPNGQSQMPVTILGRAPMMNAISDVVTDAAALFDPEATSEIRRLGRLGAYRGANVVRIQNYTDEVDVSFIPRNELWVFGGNVGKFVKYGGMQTKTWDENTADYRHYRGRMDCGGLIWRPEAARRIVDGTIDA